jgi:hypothetical protein
MEGAPQFEQQRQNLTGIGRFISKRRKGEPQCLGLGEIAIDLRKARFWTTSE